MNLVSVSETKCLQVNLVSVSNRNQNIVVEFGFGYNRIQKSKMNLVSITETKCFLDNLVSVSA